MSDMWKYRKPVLMRSFLITSYSLRRLAARMEQIITFDQDDDDTLDFVTAGANLRAYAYGIEQKTRWKVKEMAGNIVPAIATTNAIIAGLIVIQALNVLKSPLPNANAQTGSALVASSPKNDLNPALRWAFRTYANAHCAVCRPVYVTASCDTAKTTLGDIVKGVPGDSRTRRNTGKSAESGRILAEPDWDDNFERTLDSLNCGRGTILMIVDDAEEVVDLVVYNMILPDNIPPLPKRAPKPKEPTPEPAIMTGSKRRVPDDEDQEDEIQIIESDPKNRPSVNATKRTLDDASVLECTAKRLRLASTEVEVMEDEDEVVVLERLWVVL
ncbi:hypothetical protein RSAG8_05780, partial [Rhizoctonia solani AG-8 WAC10335]